MSTMSRTSCPHILALLVLTCELTNKLHAVFARISIIGEVQTLPALLSLERTVHEQARMRSEQGSGSHRDHRANKGANNYKPMKANMFAHAEE